MCKGNELETRLVNFAVSVIDLTGRLPKNYTGYHILKQIIRSSSSTAANYAEAQFAESRADFLHKIKIVLKELQETKVWLLIVHRLALIKTNQSVEYLIGENKELISIFVQSAKTAQKNKKKPPRTV
ncbi:four helix bundle protein [bacterium]|nr:four helix bundle protein [bacterium]MBU1918356.1 four helix bundle protein [bacterium]